MPPAILRLITRPTLWIVVAFGIAIADLLAPFQADLSVATLVLVPIVWRFLHRRYVPLVTGILIATVILAGIATEVLAWSSSARANDHQWTSHFARLWTVLALIAAHLFHTDLQRSRRRRLALRRELQQRVRRRTRQLQRVNSALRHEVARREATEHLLDRSETYFQGLIERMRLQVLRKDHAGMITYANDAFCRQLGRRPSDVVGSTDDDIYPAELAAAYRADDLRVMTTGQPVDHVEQHPAFDGQTGYVQVFKAPEYDQKGNCTGIQVIFWDVTQKHRSEIALRNSEERKRALFESVGDAVLLVDDQHRIVEANPSAMQLFRLSRDAMLHRRLEDALCPLQPDNTASGAGDSFDLAANDLIHGSHGWSSLPHTEQCEVKMVRQDRTSFDSEVWLHPVPIGDTHGLAIVVRDVTLRRQAFETLQEAKAAAEAASRTKSEFMAGVSHELRTPLGGIMGLSKLLIDTPLTERARQYVEMISQSASQLGDVIEDILDFAALEAGRVQIHPAPMDLHAIVGEAFKTVAARAIGKPIHLIYSIAPHTPRFVIGDSKRIRQVVINLAGNAVKFTPAGEVHVRISAANPESRSATSTHPPLSLYLDVIDTGIGIAKENQQRVFDAFERGEAGTTRTYGGTGLGLSISDGLVERMGGRIELESAPGRGSRFRCVIPLVPTNDPARPRSSVLLPNEAVLGVSDETSRIAMVEMLESFGIQAHQRVVRRSAPSKRPLLWMLGPDSPLAITMDQSRLPIDIVIWVTRLGDETPKQAQPHDSILVEPVLPRELLAAISRNQTSNSRSEQRARPTATRLAAPGKSSVTATNRLLLVDDSEVNRVLLHDQLTAFGYEVDVACNGTEAISLASRNAYACILMDLQMPDMDGTEATRAIRELYQSRGTLVPPTIALTAHVTDHHRQQCLDAGMAEFLTKPVDRDQLRTTLATRLSISPVAVTEKPTLDSSPVPIDSPPDAPAWQQQLCRLAGNDPESIRSVSEAFLEEVPLLVRRLDSALERGRLSDAARAIHTLKSCLRHVATNEETTIAQQLESRAKNGESIPDEDLARLKQLAAGWIERVQQFYDALPASIPSQHPFA